MTTSNPRVYAGFIALDPMPAPRPRARVLGRYAQVYMPSEYSTWKDKAVEMLRGAERLPPDELLARPVTVDMTVLAPKPKTSKLNLPRPDVDNYAKAALDALTQSDCWWVDDTQVRQLRVSKQWADPGEAPGISFTVTYE